MRVKRWVGGVVAVLLVGGMSGCSGGDMAVGQPATDAPKSSSSATSESPILDLSEDTDPGKESAEEFIARWAEATRQMQVTGDTEDYLPLVPTCASCLDAVSRIDRIYVGGGQVEWSGWSIEKITTAGRWDEHAYRVTATSSDMRIMESGGSEWVDVPGGPTELLVKLKKTKKSWVVLEMSLL